MAFKLHWSLKQGSLSRVPVTCVSSLGLSGGACLARLHVLGPSVPHPGSDRGGSFQASLLSTILQVEILPQGRESPIFKQFFKDWK